MSLLPRPFSCVDGGNALSRQSSVLNAKDPAGTAHFPPWYSGSHVASELSQHLSQNRSIHLGAPPSWTPTDATARYERNEFHEKRRGGGNRFNQNKFVGNNNSGKKSYCCDACNRDFSTEDELGEHQATHVKCPFGSCKFQAHPKVVALHQRLQHSTGLADKLVSLDTPEAIRKWREERKRNFPTAENIERKKKEAVEKLDRGEDLQNKYFGKMKGNRGRGQQDALQPAENGGRGRGRGRGRKRHRNRGARRPAEVGTLQRDLHLALAQPTLCQDTSEKQDQQTISSSFSMEEEERLVEENSNDSNEVEEASAKIGLPPTEKAAHVIGGSLSLLADYGSASDQDDEDDKHRKKPCKGSRFSRQSVPDLYPTHGKNQPNWRRFSLLEKLLSNEIRHERNVILQCVHYTVKKNFFDPKK